MYIEKQPLQCVKDPARETATSKGDKAKKEWNHVVGGENAAAPRTFALGKSRQQGEGPKFGDRRILVIEREGTSDSTVQRDRVRLILLYIESSCL